MKKTRTAAAGAPMLLENTSLIRRVGFLLNRSAMEIRESFDTALRPMGIDPRHFGVLSFISEGGAFSQQQIARQVCCDRTTMVSIVDDLERRGLAKRTVDPGDRRKYAVCLTEKGKRVLERARKLAGQAENAYLAALSAQERRQLIGMLQRLVLAPKSRA